MRLKRISLAGFKSFADRTRLEFEDGVNVVVGPNGTGKSNLLDAIAWVMGTQATRVLRTQKMEDVIFAGTTTRPALSRAEVNVTFDNTDGFLPLDLTEVTMTRRLFRDGTSEYELNGTSCRLLDLQELLSDGGVGRHQHVLVGQGQIGEILNARPDEHRAVIEEAAGVTKHRSRRDRSVRRLEQTGIDVDRLNDILSQQRRRLRPLKRQADAAARHDSVRAEARALRLWLGGEELRRIRHRTAEATIEQAALEKHVVEGRTELEQLRSTLDELESAAGDVGRRLQADTAAAARLETVVERLQRIGMVSRERSRALESKLLGAGERTQDLQSERDELRTQLDESADAEQRALALADRREQALRALDDEERSLAEQIRLPAEGVVANLRGDLRALETAEARDAREAEAVARRREVVAARLAEESAEISFLGQEIRATDVDVNAAQTEYDQAQAARTSAQASWEAAETALQRARMDHGAAEARVAALEAALAGLGDPAARERAAAASSVVGTIVEQLDAPQHLAAAVDAALGAWRDALVASDHRGLVEVTSELKSEGFGGVAVVTAGAGGEANAAEARRVAAEWGVETLVDALGPGADMSLASRLFGDVLLVEGWSRGWELVRRFPALRAITPEGDVVSIDGMRLADADGAGPAALEAARVALEVAERELARAGSLHSTARRSFEGAREEERVALERLEALEARLAGHTEALGLIERAHAEGTGELARLEDRRRSLEEAARDRTERIREVRARVAEFEGEEATRQAAWESLNRRRAEVAERRDDARRSREEAAAALAAIVERRKLQVGRLETIERELQALESSPVDPDRIEALVAVETAARAGVEAARVHIEALRERQRALRREAGVADDRLETAHGRRSELTRSVDEARDRSAALAVELAELRVRDEAVAERLRRDADASEQEALAASPPSLEDGADPKERLATLEADLRRMGPINPLAEAEYQELAEHVELLETQLADLEESRRELKKVISALDEEMASLFMQAFEEIATFYEENFAIVFPGGRGRLRLTDPGRPLETGVEIDAQPLGKKVGRLSLLSGGERSLAALAFLFAVFRARPSPFYVLDEVEAALDDANLRRFLRLVDTLRASAQLVIITHQQQTMEAGDILYGVTMEPGGSSKVLAKRLHRVAV